MGLYSIGKSTGVVLDSGHGLSYSVPIFEGYALPFATQKIITGGELVTKNLIQMMREEN